MLNWQGSLKAATLSKVERVFRHFLFDSPFAGAILAFDKKYEAKTLPKELSMAIFVRESKGLLLFSRSKYSGINHPGPLDNFEGDSISRKKALSILRTGRLPAFIFSDGKGPTLKEGAWILEALREWQPGTGFSKVYE